MLGKKGALPFSPPFLNPFLVPEYCGPGSLFFSLGGLRTVLGVVGLNLIIGPGKPHRVPAKCRPRGLSFVPQAFLYDYRAISPGLS